MGNGTRTQRSMGLLKSSRLTEAAHRWRRFTMVLLASLALALALSGCGGEPFEIGGAWKSVGDQSWGVVAPGTVVRFGDTVNLFSPWDTWLYEEDGADGGELTVTGALGGTYSFDVHVIDNDHIELTRGSYALELERSE